MKKQRQSVLLAITLLFVGFTLGFFLGRTRTGGDVILSVRASAVTQPREAKPETVPAETHIAEPAQTALPSETEPTITFPININTAGEAELMALPGIGEVLAGRILAYRETFGDFSHPEELMNVKGIGEKRLEAIIELITTGG